LELKNLEIDMMSPLSVWVFLVGNLSLLSRKQITANGRVNRLNTYSNLCTTRSALD